MKKIVLGLIIMSSSFVLNSQILMRMEVKEDIEGICDKNEVYALFSGFEGQIKALCPINEENLNKILNSEMEFLQSNKKFRSKKGIIGLIINCKGEIVQCKMSNSTGNKELDKEIELIFNSLGEWKPGKLNGKEVDSSQLFSFKVKKGKIRLN